ncbi:Ras-related C3 botulinum toxin substrate 1 [Psilocybe cubensis]|uniref:Ras-related C3 botulinum toxin substrate 1 n=1 Tax=Psilocybe cubensis TaxID=181762 RepID=A0ACB8H2R3_PSICU|nr:Ras-related C3 botulinum toxin substrate 1 [Psilocybe cubensis]KAH9482131.1 Ras-related C3 botulinum toxin substrate 1 [Psilocybe cubensis]
MREGIALMFFLLGPLGGLSIFDGYCARRIIDGNEYSVSLFDTAGGDEYDRLRPLAYPQTDIFVMCFSVVDRTSYENISLKWAPEIEHHNPSVPILLVGTKVDLRNDSMRDRHNSILEHHHGMTMCKDIGAAYYVECSSYTGCGVKSVFEEAMRLAANPPPKLVPARRRKCVVT